ncbi:membrane protein insertion efficiency factor YidD [Microcoleus sp. FACHB-672]|uniref:membrane protein insertion efficiency factor YidD n=1 Tax=Microcoleus sp. FACHB-672 TaxID=2692825 RepID=UPI001F55307C|nr:membrane protein insertion efficiency factor YidD [Microcoleus sp. FACHB-672]
MGENVMDATHFQTAGRQIAISSIDAYKTYISPRKGFSCAHRMLHQGDSCSDYVKRMFSTENLMPALQMSRQRFRDCAGAGQILKATKATGGCIIIPCCLPI